MLTRYIPPRGRTPSATNRYQVQVGSLNAQAQRVEARLGASVNGMRGQTLYVLRCERPGCGHRYCEEGIRVAQRRCPACDGGAEGLAAPEPERTLFDAI